MPESKEELAPSHAPDFNQEVRNAQQTGDFDFVLETARKSHKMLLDFRDVIKGASFAGKDVMALAMGLSFLENLIGNAAGQISALKQAEKQTREALKASLKSKGDPEKPGEPEKPAEPPTSPSEAPVG